MIREIFKLRGIVTSLGELTHIPRQNISDIYKRLLTINLADGQIVFPEIRNKKLKLLEENNIQEGDLVEIDYMFQGSEKNGKRYNNIYINNITKI